MHFHRQKTLNQTTYKYTELKSKPCYPLNFRLSIVDTAMKYIVLYSINQMNNLSHTDVHSKQCLDASTDLD